MHVRAHDQEAPESAGEGAGPAERPSRPGAPVQAVARPLPRALPAIAPRGRQPQDERLLVLFDLNGVLVAKRKRSPGRPGAHRVRPGIEVLLDLEESGVRLGVFTSCTEPTALAAIGSIQEALSECEWARALAMAGGDPEEGGEPPLPGIEGSGRPALPEPEGEAREADGLEGAFGSLALQGERSARGRGGGSPGGLAREGPAPPFFDVVLIRDHCVPQSHDQIRRRGGNSWDTLKPLRRHFQDLSRIILVDDSAHKILEDEVDCWLPVPEWKGERDDDALSALARLCGAGSATGGVAEAADAVRKALAERALAPRAGQATDVDRRTLSGL